MAVLFRSTWCIITEKLKENRTLFWNWFHACTHFWYRTHGNTHIHIFYYMCCWTNDNFDFSLPIVKCVFKMESNWFKNTQFKMLQKWIFFLYLFRKERIRKENKFQWTLLSLFECSLNIVEFDYDEKKETKYKREIKKHKFIVICVMQFCDAHMHVWEWTLNFISSTQTCDTLNANVSEWEKDCKKCCHF